MHKLNIKLVLFIIYLNQRNIVKCSNNDFISLLVEENFIWKTNNKNFYFEDITKPETTKKTLQNHFDENVGFLLLESEKLMAISLQCSLYLLNPKSLKIEKKILSNFFFNERPAPFKALWIKNSFFVIVITIKNDQLVRISPTDSKSSIVIPESYTTYSDISASLSRVVLISQDGIWLITLQIPNFEKNKIEKSEVGYKGAGVVNLIHLAHLPKSEKFLFQLSNLFITIFDLNQKFFEKRIKISEKILQMNFIKNTNSYLLLKKNEIELLDLTFNEMILTPLLNKIFTSNQYIISFSGAKKSPWIALLLSNSKIEYKFLDFKGKACAVGCSNCSQPINSQSCNSCFEGFEFSKESLSCTPKCNIPNFYENKNCVSKCSKGFFKKDKNSCAPCSLSCLECSTLNFCTKCVNGFADHKGNCGFASCSKGSYYNQELSRCDKCAPYCSTCSKSAASCLDCSIPTNSNYTICVKACPEYLTPNYNTLSCDIIEEPNCLIATSNSSPCTKCSSGYFNNFGNCIKNCKENQFENFVYDRCERCLPGWKNCTQCQSPLYLYNNKCVFRCPGSYYASETERKCFKCSEPNCIECFDDACSVCTAGLIVQNGKCEEISSIVIERPERRFYFSSGIIILILLFPIYILLIYSCFKLFQTCWKQFKSAREFRAMIREQELEDIELQNQERRRGYRSDEDDAIVEAGRVSEFDSEGEKIPEVIERFMDSKERKNKEKDRAQRDFSRKKKKHIINVIKREKRLGIISRHTPDGRAELLKRLILGSVEEINSEIVPYRIPEIRIGTEESSLREKKIEEEKSEISIENVKKFELFEKVNSQRKSVTRANQLLEFGREKNLAEDPGEILDPLSKRYEFFTQRESNFF